METEKILAIAFLISMLALILSLAILWRVITKEKTTKPISNGIYVEYLKGKYNNVDDILNCNHLIVKKGFCYHCNISKTDLDLKP